MDWHPHLGARGIHCNPHGGCHRIGHGALPGHCHGQEGHIRIVVCRALDHSGYCRWLVAHLFSDGLDRHRARIGIFVPVVLPVFAHRAGSHVIGSWFVASTVEGVNIPSHLRYSKDHEWVLVTGTTARVGITDYAQDALGDIVFIQLPEVGSTVSLHDGLGEIESTKSVNDVYAPVSGVVESVNTALSDTPELLNTDPYEAGWICEIANAVIDDSALMSADEYSALIGA